MPRFGGVAVGIAIVEGQTASGCIHADHRITGIVAKDSDFAAVGSQGCNLDGAGRGIAPEKRHTGSDRSDGTGQACGQRMAAVGDSDLGLSTLIIGSRGQLHIIKQAGLPGHNRHGHIAELGVNFAGTDGIRDQDQVLAGCISGAGSRLRLDDDKMTECLKMVNQQLVAGCERC